MHRIEGQNVLAQNDKNYFRTSAPYTVMSPEWANAVQEEIMNAIEQAGLPVYDKETDPMDQLFKAIKKLVARKWQAGQYYELGEEVVRGNSKFLCVTTHTAGTYFHTDWLTNEYWVAIGDGPGTCKMCARSAGEPGFLFRDGKDVGKSGSGADYEGDDYRDLYEYLGATWGGTQDWDNSDTINIPDDRGLFERGAGQHGTMTKADGNPFDGGSVGDQENDKFQGWQLGTTLSAVDYYSRSSGINLKHATTAQAGQTLTVNDSAGQGSTAMYTAFNNGTHGDPRQGNETNPAYSVKLPIIKY